MSEVKPLAGDEIAEARARVADGMASEFAWCEVQDVRRMLATIDARDARLAEVERERDEARASVAECARVREETTGVPIEKELAHLRGEGLDPFHEECRAKLAAAEARADEAGRILGEVIVAGTLRVGERLNNPSEHAAVSAIVGVIEDRDILEKDLLLIADALGYVNRADGQAGYERADAATLVEAIRRLEREAASGREAALDAAAPPEPSRAERLEAVLAAARAFDIENDPYAYNYSLLKQAVLALDAAPEHCGMVENGCDMPDCTCHCARCRDARRE